MPVRLCAGWNCAAGFAAFCRTAKAEYVYPLAGRGLLLYGAPMRRRFVTGVAPGLQNRWQALRSVVGSTPIRLRQVLLHIIVIQDDFIPL